MHSLLPETRHSVSLANHQRNSTLQIRCVRPCSSWGAEVGCSGIRPISDTSKVPRSGVTPCPISIRSQIAPLGGSSRRIAPLGDRCLVVPAATSRSDYSGQPFSDSPGQLTFNAVYKFSRPHTMIGTAISIISISALALQGVAPSGEACRALAEALLSALLMNISIVGTNQVFDVEIDKVNKPTLPLASGEMTVTEGINIVVISTVASLLVGWASGSAALMATLVVSWILGMLYSVELPFMRWKRSPLLAAGCILAVRAVIVQLGFYTHMALAVGGVSSIQELVSTLSTGGPVAFTVTFMLFFSIVIALFKDIPDVKGDDQSGIKTLSVQLGVKKVFWTCIGLLTTAYALACGYAVMRAPVAGLLKTVMSFGGHAILAGLLWRGALEVDTEKTSDLTKYYMFIWKLFYAEYLIIPFLG